MYKAFEKRGVIFITMMIFTQGSGAKKWADRFNLTHPVVAAPDFDISADFFTQFENPLGSWIMMEPGMKIVDRGLEQFSEADLEKIAP